MKTIAAKAVTALRQTCRSRQSHKDTKPQPSGPVAGGVKSPPREEGIKQPPKFRKKEMTVLLHKGTKESPWYLCGFSRILHRTLNVSPVVMVSPDCESVTVTRME